MKQRPLRFESLEERRLLAVTAGLDASAPLPAPTAAAPAGYAVGDVYIASTVDTDGDGFIGPSELSYMSYAWFAADGSENWNPASDLDGDGFIGPGDYALLSSYWFKTNDQLPDETKSYAVYPSDISNWYLFGDKLSNMSVKDGTLTIDASDGPLEMTCDYEKFAENLRVTADFTPGGENFRAGIELAVQRNGHRYYAEFRNEKVVLYTVGNSESMTQLHSAKYQFAASETYTVWVQNADGQLACGVGDEVLIALDEDSLSGGMVGFYASAGVGNFSNISVEFDPDRVDNTPPPQPRIIRIVTYNIRSCQGASASSVDPSVPGAVIADLHADLVGMQEVDQNTTRSGGIDQAAAIGGIAGLDSYFAKAINRGGGGYGIATLSGLPVVSTRQVALPGEEERRTLLELEFEDFVLFNTHLSLTVSSREESAVIIRDELALYDKPVILIGDMNIDYEWPDLFGGTWTSLCPYAPTYPAKKPTVRVDYIAIADPTGTISVNSPIWTAAVADAGVEATVASDHLPVYVDLDLAKILEYL